MQYNACTVLPTTAIIGEECVIDTVLSTTAIIREECVIDTVIHSFINYLND